MKPMATTIATAAFEVEPRIVVSSPTTEENHRLLEEAGGGPIGADRECTSSTTSSSEVRRKSTGALRQQQPRPSLAFQKFRWERKMKNLFFIIITFSSSSFLYSPCTLSIIYYELIRWSYLIYSVSIYYSSLFITGRSLESCINNILIAMSSSLYHLTCHIYCRYSVQFKELHSIQFHSIQ